MRGILCIFTVLLVASQGAADDSLTSVSNFLRVNSHRLGVRFVSKHERMPKSVSETLNFATTEAKEHPQYYYMNVARLTERQIEVLAQSEAEKFSNLCTRVAVDVLSCGYTLDGMDKDGVARVLAAWMRANPDEARRFFEK